MAASRPDVYQRVLLGPETTTGVAVAATRDFPSLSIQFARQHMDQFYRPAGKIVPESGVRHREWSTPSYEGALDYNEIVYVLSGLFGAPTPSNLSGSAYSWAFAPTGSSFGTAKTFTARQGDTVASALVPGLHFNSMECTISREDARISGNCFGYAIEETQGPLSATLTDEVQQLAITGDPTGGTFTITYDAQTTGAIAYNATAAEVEAALIALSNIGADDVRCYGGQLPGTPVTIHFTGTLGATNVSAVTTTDSLTGGSTPATAITTLQAGAGSFTSIAQQPVSISQINVYIDSSYGNIGTTKYCDALEAYWTIPDIRNPVMVLCRTYPSFKDAVAQPVEGANVRLTLIKNTDVISLVDAINTATKPTRYVRIEAIGANITGAYYYTIQADFAVKCAVPEERRNVEGVYAYDLNLQVVNDSTMGGPCAFTVHNTRSAL